MKTPMQELIELITLKENKEDGGVFLMPYITIAKLESMLEKEKEVAQQYAEFAIECDRKELPILEFDGWINL